MNGFDSPIQYGLATAFVAYWVTGLVVYIGSIVMSPWLLTREEKVLALLVGPFVWPLSLMDNDGPWRG